MNTQEADKLIEPQSSATPSRLARVLAFSSILLGGACGGLIGYTVTDLQCSKDCTNLASVLALAGAVLAAAGVGIVANLVLRAMSEWQSKAIQTVARERHPVD